MNNPVICHFCNEPITKMNGNDSDSLLNHHITYIPEVKVPAHIGCHVRYHRTHPEHPKNPEIEYRKRLIEGGEDIFCHFCAKPIIKLNGLESESLVLHSLDGNHDNWDPDNKVPAHRGCHVKYHMSGKPKTLEHRQKLRDVVTGKRHTEETKKKMRRPRPHTRGKNNPMYGNPRTEEWRKQHSDRMSGEGNPMYGKHHTEETKQKIRVARANQPPPMLGKHHTEETKEKLRKIAQEACQTRRERHDPTGRRPR